MLSVSRALSWFHLTDLASLENVFCTVRQLNKSVRRNFFELIFRTALFISTLCLNFKHMFGTADVSLVVMSILCILGICTCMPLWVLNCFEHTLQQKCSLITAFMTFTVSIDSLFWTGLPVEFGKTWSLSTTAEVATEWIFVYSQMYYGKYRIAVFSWRLWWSVSCFFFKKKELYQKPYCNHDAEISSVYCCLNYWQMVYCHVRRRHSADDPPHRQSPRIYERA